MKRLTYDKKKYYSNKFYFKYLEADTIYNSKYSVTINAGGGNDKINNTGRYVKIESG